MGNKYFLIDNGTIVLLNSESNTESNPLITVVGYFNDVNGKIQYVGVPVVVIKNQDSINAEKLEVKDSRSSYKNLFMTFGYEDIIVAIGTSSYAIEAQDILLHDVNTYNQRVYGTYPEVRKIGMTMQDAVDERDYNKALYLAYKFDDWTKAKEWYNKFCDINKYASLFGVSTKNIGRLKGAINNGVRMTWGVDIKTYAKT